MDDPITWLLEQVAEDERLARAAMKACEHRDDLQGTDAWRVSHGGGGVCTEQFGYRILAGPFEYTDDELVGHVVNWQPSRVLAECEAKRKLIDRYKRAVAATTSAVSSYVRGEDHGYQEACLDAIRDEAAVYAAAGRPGYQQEWKL